MSMTIRDLIDELRAAGDTCGYDAPVLCENMEAKTGDASRMCVTHVRVSQSRCVMELRGMTNFEHVCLFSGEIKSAV